MGELKNDTLYVIKKERLSFEILNKIPHVYVSRTIVNPNNFSTSYSIFLSDVDVSNLFYNDNMINDFDQFILLKDGEYFCSPIDTGYSREGTSQQFQCFYNRIKNILQVSDGYRKLKDNEKIDFIKLLTSSRIKELK